MKEMLNEVMEDVEKSLLNEIRNIIGKGSLNCNDMEAIYKAVCTIEKIRRMDLYEDEFGASQAMRMYSDQTYYPMPPAPYANYNYPNPTMRHTSSRHSIEDRMIANLENMMNSETGDYNKQVISDWIAKMRK